MGIVKGYFQTVFSKLNMKYTHGEVAMEISLDRFGKKIDKAQDALDAQVWADMKQYMPIATGNLIQRTGDLNANTRGEVYLYDPSVPYAHYMYEGTVYVEPDPYPNVGGFYSPSYGWWSIPGVQKVPSDRRLMYTSPTAVSYWGAVAYENHHEQWVAVAKAAVRE